MTGVPPLLPSRIGPVEPTLLILRLLSVAQLDSLLAVLPSHYCCKSTKLIEVCVHGLDLTEIFHVTTTAFFRPSRNLPRNVVLQRGGTRAGGHFVVASKKCEARESRNGVSSNLER